MAAKVSSNVPSPRGVRRALNAMHSNMGHDWTVAGLAAAADVSSRTLQRQFRDFLGKSPHAVLRNIRLEWARFKLLQGLRDEKVRDVAMTCGLPHFGRFAREYRHRYGETPSQTARRQALFTKALVKTIVHFVRPQSNENRPASDQLHVRECRSRSSHGR